MVLPQIKLKDARKGREIRVPQKLLHVQVVLVPYHSLFPAWF